MWYRLSNARHTITMSEEIHEGEEDGKRFLHAKYSIEGPFSVELDDGFEHWRVPVNPSVRDDVLACVVAFCWAVPEEEAEVKCYIKSPKKGQR